MESEDGNQKERGLRQGRRGHGGDRAGAAGAAEGAGDGGHGRGGAGVRASGGQGGPGRGLPLDHRAGPAPVAAGGQARKRGAGGNR